MLRSFILSALLTIAAMAFAGQHYVEVWNPSEAHGSVSPNTAREHKSPKKRQATAKRMSMRGKQRGLMKSVAAPLPASAATERRVPTFDDIPRRKTPQGDVLRVHGDVTQVHVQR